MRLMFLGDRIIAGNSAYSKIGLEVCTRLAKSGHQVAHTPIGRVNKMGKQVFNNVLIYPSGDDYFAEDVALANYVDFKADMLFTIKDTWVWNHIFRLGLNFVPFAIVDHSPVSAAITSRLDTAFKVIAVSRFGQIELNKKKIPSVYIPHAVRCDLYKPLSPEQKTEARRLFGLPQDAYVVGIVAMNRCFPAGTRILTPEGYVNIERIENGDRVISGNGQVRNVTAKFSRETTKDERLVDIRVQGSKSLKCTGNHHLYIVKKSSKEKNSRGFTLESLYYGIEPMKVKAEDVIEGDYLVVPITRNFNNVFLKIKGDIGINVDVKMARLIGYYLAEGMVTKFNSKRCRVQWTFNKNETDYIQEVRQLCKEIFNSPTCTQIVRNVCHVILYGKEIAIMFAKNFGRTSREKTIGAMIRAEPLLQLEMFKTYWNGDGSDETITRNQFSVASYSEKLMLEMQQVLVRNGIWGNYSLSRDHSNIKHELRIANREANKLFPIKIEKEKSSAIVYDDYVLLRVRQVERYNAITTITVYDLEVEQDHNYIAENFKVSNSRKLIPRMLRGFKRFRDLNPDINAHMFLWTNVQPRRPSEDVTLGVSDVGVNLIPEIMELGLNEVVHWPNWEDVEKIGGLPEHDPLGNWDMSKLYGSFDVNFLCSGGEACGLPYLEAAAVGVPSIGTNYSGAPEHIGPGLTVSWHDYIIFNTPGVRYVLPDIDGMAEALRKIYDGDREKMARKCRKFAESYDWNLVTDLYWKPFLEKCSEELYPLLTKDGVKSWA